MPKFINSKTAQRRRLEKISAFELGRPKARMGNPNTGIGEVIVQPQYDIYFAAAANALTLLNLFTLQQGMTYNFMGVPAFAKGPGHTTLVQPGMLDSSYTFIIRGISVYMQGLQGTATEELGTADALHMAGTYGRLEVNHHPYWEGILAWLPGGGGIITSGFGNTTAPNVAGNAVNGQPQSKNIYAIPGGIMINPQENFSFIINPTLSAGGAPTLDALVLPTAGPPSSGVSAWVRWDGTLIRVA
jgi:hypothetical protein